MTDKMPRILLIDDSPMKRALLCSFLEDFYLLTEAEDGKQAIQILSHAEDSYDAVLLDLKMPEMDGFQILEWMGEQNSITRIPVIVISAEDDQDSIQKAYMLGAIDYFTVPFDADTVRQRLGRVLTLYKQYEGLVDVSGQMLFVCERQTRRILYASASFCEYYEITREKLYQEICGELPKIGEPIVRYDEKRDRYLRAETRASSWGNRETYTIMLTDVTNLVKQTQEQKLAFQNNVNSMLAKGQRCGVVAQLNLTRNQCYEVQGFYRDKFQLEQYESAEELIRRISQLLDSAKEQEAFCQTFSIRHLEQVYADGVERQLATYLCGVPEGKPFHLQVWANVYRDVMTGDLEAILYVLDYTEELLHQKIQQVLYDETYQIVGVLNLRSETIVIQRRPRGQKEVQSADFYVDYQTFRQELMEQYIPQERWDSLSVAFSENVIQSRLQKDGEYSKTIHFVLNGHRRTAHVLFRWFRKELSDVLVTIEDVTEKSEQDGITEVCNRHGFFNRSEYYLRHCENPTQYAVLLFNIRRFKAVNHLVGIEGGDWVLRQYAKMLQNSFLKPRLIGRTEADRFVCLVDLTNLEYDGIGKLCETEMIYCGRKLQLKSYVGIYLVGGETMNINEMYDNAKIASKHIRDEYVQPYEVFSAEMRSLYLGKNQIVSAFRSAMDAGDFQVYYQPVLCLKTGKIVSAEALIRWKFGGRDLHSPGEFLPALEESGQISQLDAYVIRMVRKFQKNRHHQQILTVPISVNLSWMDFYDHSMMDWLREEFGSPAEEEVTLRYEITETSYAALEGNRQNILKILRSQGNKIMLDDFGSGYSSFSMLRNYEFDILKLDMGFVRQIEENEKVRKIIRAVVDMSHSIGIEVVAEGVETREQLEYLKGIGCDYIQGYYFSKPLPESEFTAMLDQAEADRTE